MKVGLNLFSIRNHLKTEEDFEQAAFALKEMGYSFMQYSGGKFVPEMIKRVSEKTGLDTVLTHVPIDRIINDTKTLMEEHSLFGCKYIGLGMMPFEAMETKEKLAETVSLLEDAAMRMEENGCKLFYHNHHFEFYRHGKETVFDYLINNAPHLHFTLDTYWLQYGGVDMCEIADRLKGRIECVHLKDYKITKTPEGGFEPRMCPVGDGTLDFEKFISHAKSSGTEYFLVEQDNAADMADTLGQVKRSIEYINRNF